MGLDPVDENHLDVGWLRALVCLAEEVEPVRCQVLDRLIHPARLEGDEAPVDALVVGVPGNYLGPVIEQDMVLVVELAPHGAEVTDDLVRPRDGSGEGVDLNRAELEPFRLRVRGTRTSLQSPAGHEQERQGLLSVPVPPAQLLVLRPGPYGFDREVPSAPRAQPAPHAAHHGLVAMRAREIPLPALVEVLEDGLRHRRHALPPA